VRTVTNIERELCNEQIERDVSLPRDVISAKDAPFPGGRDDVALLSVPQVFPATVRALHMLTVQFADLLAAVDLAGRLGSAV